MKIRFLEEWPRIEDKEGSFELRCVGGISAPSIGEIVAARSKEELREASVQIYACTTSSTGTLLCYDHFRSCAEATKAMTATIEIAGDSLAYGYANRCVKAGKAELIE